MINGIEDIAKLLNVPSEEIVTIYFEQLDPIYDEKGLSLCGGVSYFVVTTTWEARLEVFQEDDRFQELKEFFEAQCKTELSQCRNRMLYEKQNASSGTGT